MVVLEPDHQVLAGIEESPELLFPEARQRRRRRWLVRGGLVLFALGLMVGLLLSVVRGAGVTPPGRLGPAADRLVAAIRDTEASGTAEIETTQRSTDLVPPGTPSPDSVSVAYVRFHGDPAAVRYLPPNQLPGAGPSYFFGHTLGLL